MPRLSAWIGTGVPDKPESHTASRRAVDVAVPVISGGLIPALHLSLGAPLAAEVAHVAIGTRQAHLAVAARIPTSLAHDNPVSTRSRRASRAARGAIAITATHGARGHPCLATKHTEEVARQAATEQALLCAEHLTLCASHRPDLCKPIIVTLLNATTAAARPGRALTETSLRGPL